MMIRSQKGGKAMGGQQNTNEKERFFLNKESEIRIEEGKIVIYNVKRNGSKSIYVYDIALEVSSAPLLAKLRTQLIRDLQKEKPTIL